MTWDLVRGEAYDLSTLVLRFGGNKQSGIIPSKREPAVILISDPKSKRVYNNTWRQDGVFEYVGQGRIGDMTWTNNNKAIRDHSSDGRSLLLFQTEKKQKRYIGEFVLGQWRLEDRLDDERNLRKAFIFELHPLDSVADSVDGSSRPSTTDLARLRELAFAAAAPSVPVGTSRRTIYQRSSDVRAYVLARARGMCQGCDHPAPFRRLDGSPYLEPHHIRRASDGGPDDPRFVIALCPNCHRRVHAGADGKEFNMQLLAMMPSIEPPS